LKKWDLPIGWEWKSFNDIGIIQSGGTPSTKEPQNFDGDIPWITPADLSNFNKKYITHGHRNISSVGVSKSSATILPKGTILCSTRAPIGYVAIASNPLTTNQGFKSLILKSNNIIPEYVFYYLKGNKQVFDNLASGTTFLEVSGLNFKKIPIPIPPLETQQRIVAILDKAEEIKRLRAEANTQTQKLIQSVFLDMFGDPVKNPKKWNVYTLQEMTTEIVDCPHSTPTYSGEKRIFPCIRTTEIKNGQIDWSEMKFVDELEYNERTRRLKPINGDIVFGREGTFGGAIRLPKGHNFCLGQRVMLFRPDFSKCNSDFLWALLNSQYIYSQALRCASGATVFHVNVKDVKKFHGFCPPIEMQNHFSSSLRKIESLRAYQNIALVLSTQNINCLHTKVFSGELVT